MNTLLIIMAGVGAANAIVNEYVFEWLRRLLPSWEWLGMLFSCTTCLGFWCGLILGLCFGYGWWCIPIGLCSSIIGRIITIWEDK